MGVFVEAIQDSLRYLELHCNGVYNSLPGLVYIDNDDKQQEHDNF